MKQFVIRTGSKFPSEHYLSKTHTGTYFYSASAYIYKSGKDVKDALTWAEKDVQSRIRELKKTIVRLHRETSKNNSVGINKVLLDKNKQSLKEYKNFQFTVIKL